MRSTALSREVNFAPRSFIFLSLRFDAKAKYSSFSSILFSCGIPQVDHVAIFPHVISLDLIRDGLLEKWRGTGRWGRNKKKITQGKMSPNKFMKWNPKKKNHGKDGPGISLKPEWFPVYQRLFLRGFRFLSCLHHSATREKSFYSRLRRSYLRPLADTEDSCRTQEKPQGTRMTTSFGGRRKTSARTREDKTKLIINRLITLLKTKYITI